jgi:general secretion pathway protein G
MMNHSSRRNSGFTLIEIMIVVVILAILAAIVVPKFMGAPGKARNSSARIDIKGIVTALNLYKLDNYTYPTTEQGLKALVTKPSVEPIPHNWRQYLNKVPKDPWGVPFHYVYPGAHSEAFDVWTNGPPNSQKKRQIGNWNSDENNSGNGNNSNG